MEIHYPCSKHGRLGDLVRRGWGKIASQQPSTLLEQTKRMGDVVWSELVDALRLLEQGTNLCPPLHSAFSEILLCLDVVRSAAVGHEDYKDLAQELKTMVDIVSQNIEGLRSDDDCSNIVQIAESIKLEASHILKHPRSSATRRHNQEKVLKNYRQIKILFQMLQNDVILRSLGTTRKHYNMSLLQRLSPVYDARYNSAYSTTLKRRNCTAETREQIRSDLQNWVQNPDAAQVYWMNGMAGTGKTTIAYSMCEWLESNSMLGASFFCSRFSPACRNINRIIPTIAYQLACYSATFQSALCRVLEDDPDIGSLNVFRQCEMLLQGPLEKVKVELPGYVMVIDALDESDDDHGMRLVMEALLRLAAHLPLRILITSRPEPEICHGMLDQGRNLLSVFHLHDVQQALVERDIRTFLREELSSLKLQDEQIQQLTNQAGKLFIYAATAARYILPRRGYENSMARLNNLLKSNSQSQAPVEGEAEPRYKEIDDLYNNILTATFEGTSLERHEKKDLRTILRTVICSKESMNIPTVARLLSLTEPCVSSALESLHSVLHVSEGERLVSTFHASFSDYMLDPSRSTTHHCNEAQHSHLLAKRCFTIMQEQLRFNICGLKSSLIFDRDVPDLKDRVEQFIHPELLYACRYWGAHVNLSDNSEELCKMLDSFLTRSFLFWMEALNLAGSIETAILTLTQAHEWISDNRPLSDTVKDTADARNFVTIFALSSCSRSTCHLYTSALAFCPPNNSVYRNWWERIRRGVVIEGDRISRRERAALSTWRLNSEVTAVATSPDGVRVVSGMANGTVWIRSGAGEVLAGPLKGHTNWVSSVAFSPNGAYVVSGSHDDTIRVWDASTGEPVTEPLRGHKHAVNSVAFSPDSTRIASGSNDHTIRVWEVQTGSLVAGPFEGHTSWVNSVAFSPDGSRVASGSWDDTIRIWNACTGELVQGPFKGHTWSVNSVAFNSDGTRIVSGSRDKTIRVWDADTGKLVFDPLEGHTGSVVSVAFSPNDAHVVSGSWDNTIRIWDTQTGKLVTSPLHGHTRSITSVLFSPNGVHVISGSRDMTVRIWDACATTNTPKLYEKQREIIIPAPAQHSGQYDVASGLNCSIGSTRSPENPITRGMARCHQTHPDPVNTVLFSPDGASVVSRSKEHVLVWNAHNGDMFSDSSWGHQDVTQIFAFYPSGASINTVHDAQATRMQGSCTPIGSFSPFYSMFDGLETSAISLSPDVSRVASGSSKGLVYLWDACTGDLITKGPQELVVGIPAPQTRPVTSLAFSPDNTRILSGYEDGSVSVWDIPTGNLIAPTNPFRKHLGRVTSVSFSSNSTYIVSGSGDGSLQFWDVSVGLSMRFFRIIRAHTSCVTAVKFSLDDSKVVSGSQDKSICVWDVCTGILVAGPFLGHTASINSVAFSPDGSCVVSGSEDKTARVWDLREVEARDKWLRSKGRSSGGVFIEDPDEIRVSFSSHDDQIHDHKARLFTRVQHNHHACCKSNKFCTVSSDGWIMVEAKPLLWTPPDLHPFLSLPRELVHACLHDPISFDPSDFMLGERWPECYSYDQP